MLTSIYLCFSYVKKLIEEAQLTDDTLKLLQFVSWENPHMSKTILGEVLWHIAFAYCNELKHHTDLLLALLRMEDSWQTHRILNALKGNVSYITRIRSIIRYRLHLRIDIYFASRAVRRSRWAV